jgi:hypothetical protein
MSAQTSDDQSADGAVQLGSKTDLDGSLARLGADRLPLADLIAAAGHRKSVRLLEDVEGRLRSICGETVRGVLQDEVAQVTSAHLAPLREEMALLRTQMANMELHLGAIAGAQSGIASMCSEKQMDLVRRLEDAIELNRMFAASTSWKITAPIRWVAALYRKYTRRS